MSQIRINSIEIQNYRSFGEKQSFIFPNKDYKKPVAIIGYNNSGKTNFMNCILYGIGKKRVAENEFEKTDLHKLDYENQIEIRIALCGSDYSCASYYDKIARTYRTEKNITGFYTIETYLEYGELVSKLSSSLFGMKQYQIFYINFHTIKEEISTQKTSWGNLKSFLAKHIKKLVDTDEAMQVRKGDFNSELEKATQKILEGDGQKASKSKLSIFIENIKKNCNKNLRDNNINIDFGLSDYEDIFLQMMFKIGLNGNKENLVPIDHFGDGYISMFVMAVIQAIAEYEQEDKCLFLFEEPESFLHENYQEYFYKVVLCGLAEKGHQVIYTTHSGKMLDVFDTKGLIRLDIENDQSVKKYNNVEEFSIDSDTEINEILTLEKYNEFIKTIEPNLNKILFSKKIILVEGPNDLMVYKYCIQKEVEKQIECNETIQDKKKYAEAYLNFHNISIIPHHGKATAIYLIQLCKHFGVDCFVINDYDLEEKELNLESLFAFEDLQKLKEDNIYKTSINKSMMTTNFNLIKTATKEKIHFNISKLEKIIGYEYNDKNSCKIYNHITNANFTFDEKLFPISLRKFLEINFIGKRANTNLEKDTTNNICDGIPF